MQNGVPNKLKAPIETLNANFILPYVYEIGGVNKSKLITNLCRFQRV